MAPVMMDGDGDDDELRRALAHLYRNPDAVPESLRAALLSARTAGPPVELDEPAEPDEDDVERKAAEDDDPDDEDDRPNAAGVVLVAADTGRALMLQRSYDDADDPARGKWEWPGGKLEDDDPTPLDAAKREWSEEVGQSVPDGHVEAHAWRSPNGVYSGHVLIVPSEEMLDLSAERAIVNPDDDSEQVAWWDLGDAMRNPALRREVQRTPWNAIRRALAKVRRETDVQEKAVQVEEIEVKASGDQDGDGIPDAKDPTPKGSPAGKLPDKKKGGKGRHVASEAGSKRYGLPIGAEIGTARDDDGQKAQDDPKAREAYQKLLTANPREYRAMLDKMSDEDLQQLSRVAYSFRSTNPQVVQARLALAASLKRRGQDVNDFGGLGKGRPSGRANTGPVSATHPGAANRRGSAKTPAKYAGRRSVDVGEGQISEGDRQALLAAGWKGRPGDSAERLYPPAGSSSSRAGGQRAGTGRKAPAAKTPPGEDPSWVPGESWQTRRARRTKLGLMGRSVPPAARQKRGENGQLMTLHIYEDGSWQYKSATPDAELIETADGGGYVFVEVKAARPTDPWEAALYDVEAKKADKGGTDDAGINNIGDLAAAIKRAKGIKDEEKRDAARAKIRKAAGRLKATNMIPKDWSKGDGDSDADDGKAKWTPPWVKGKSLPDELDTMDPFELAAYIEAKTMSPDPNAAKLREYWAHGAGRKKWRPGTGGDFERLRRHLKKYVPVHMLNGLTANIHKLATGEWPGPKAHGGKSAYGDDVEVKISADMLAAAQDIDPDADGDDAISLALDRYSDIADELTTEEEYEEALAREIDWDLLPDGTLERADGQGGHRVLDGLTLDDDHDETPSDDPADALDGLEELLAG